MSTKPPVPIATRMHDPSLTGALKEQCVRWAHMAADRGLFGLRPTRTVVVCGLPRSGTTLLHLMLQTGYPDSKHFPRERSAKSLVRQVWPGRHTLLISKRPNDIFWIDEIRASYQGRAKSPRFIVTTRDPRAVLTSRHKDQPGYYVTVDRWQALMAHIRYVRTSPDVLIVDYRELVENPQEIQRRLVEVVGQPPSAPLDSYTEAVPAGFKTNALNGVRPIDTASVDKWREPQHADRIRSLLVNIPELTDLLVKEGYEPDDAWAAPYR
jgi:hypothetical protein